MNAIPIVNIWSRLSAVAKGWERHMQAHVGCKIRAKRHENEQSRALKADAKKQVYRLRFARKGKIYRDGNCSFSSSFETACKTRRLSDTIAYYYAYIAKCICVHGKQVPVYENIYSTIVNKRKRSPAAR